MEIGKRKIRWKEERTRAEALLGGFCPALSLLSQCFSLRIGIVIVYFQDHGKEDPAAGLYRASMAGKQYEK